MAKGAAKKRERPIEAKGTRSHKKRTRICTDAIASSLCERCYGIQSAAKTQCIKTDMGYRIATVNDTTEQLAMSICGLCRLLATIKSPDLNGRECRLYVYSANFVYAHVRAPVLKKHDVSLSALLGFVPSTTRSTTRLAGDFIGMLKLEQESQSTYIGPRRIEKDRIDYNMLKNWMSYCQAKHRPLCRPGKMAVVEHLQVFNVDTKKTIKAPKDCEYVALSYVWGACTAPQGRLPKVVEDSMIVTKELGFKYLWVDKHCIDQNNLTEKHDQVKAMHLVYGQAALTIIAAAGEDSDYGLPGVSDRKRAIQGSLVVGDNIFIRTFPYMSVTIGASRWATRGWTLQEAVLSKRRLIFTDQQIAFQCNGMHCYEAVKWPYELMHAKSSPRFPENVPGSPFSRLTLNPRSWNIEKTYLSLVDILEQYSNRTLSYSSDSLNAFLGVLASFSTLKDPIYHIWGVAVVARFKSWNLKIDWIHRKPCMRLAQFPSWSWAGWSGPVSQGMQNQSWTGNRNAFYAYLEKDHRGEEADIIDLQTFGDEHDKYSDYVTGSPFLRLRIKAVSFQLTWISWSTFSEAAKEAYYHENSWEDDSRPDCFKDGLYIELPRRGYTELAYFYADDESLDVASVQEGTLRAMILETDAMSGGLSFIGLKHRGDDRYERLGYFLFMPGTMRPTSDHGFRLDNGKLSKIRPDIASSLKVRERLLWEKNYEVMDIRLG